MLFGERLLDLAGQVERRDAAGLDALDAEALLDGLGGERRRPQVLERVQQRTELRRQQ